MRLQANNPECLLTPSPSLQGEGEFPNSFSTARNRRPPWKFRGLHANATFCSLVQQMQRMSDTSSVIPPRHTCTRRIAAWAPVLVVLLTVALGAALSGCGKSETAQAKGQQGKKKSGGRPPALIRVEPVVERMLAPKVIVVGTVTPIRKSIVASGANGVVDYYHVEEGEWIEQGAVLSELRMESSRRQIAQAEELLEQYKAEYDEALSYEPELVEAAKFRKEAAEIAMTIAQQRYQRAVDAYEKQAINENDLDDAEERAKQTAADYKAALAEYQRLKGGPRPEKRQQAQRKVNAQQEHVGFLNAEHAKRTTKAPFPGFIVAEHSYVGQWLSKGDPVATLARLDYVDVVVNVDQSNIHLIQLGQQAGVTIDGAHLTRLTTKDDRVLQGLIEKESAADIVLVDADGQSHTVSKDDIAVRETRPWTGTVVQIIARSDWQTGSRGFPVKVRIPNRFRHVSVPSDKSEPERQRGKKQPTRTRKQPVLKEGMMATVTFRGTKVKTYLVPKDALVRSTQGMKVNFFRPSPDNPKQGSTFQVRVKTGIADGEYIQITPHPANPGEVISLKPGMLVVTEGGERLLPVHSPVQVVPKPDAANREDGG